MKSIGKIILTLLALALILGVWYWAEKKDYFNSEYNDLKSAQQEVFEWQPGDDEEKLIQRYRQHFFDKEYMFPRQRVTKVKLFTNVPILSSIKNKTLKSENIDSFVHFFSDTTNFHWGETTWRVHNSKYYCRFYNANNKVVGKVYFCLEDCGTTSSIPFSPNMKFGGLSEKGLSYIKQLFADETKWQ